LCGQFLCDNERDATVDDDLAFTKAEVFFQPARASLLLFVREMQSW
jgi:hypothetical protein